MATCSTYNCSPLKNMHNHLIYLRRTKKLSNEFKSITGLARWILETFEMTRDVEVKSSDMKNLVSKGKERPFYWAIHKLEEADLVTYKKIPYGKGFKHRLILQKKIENKYLVPYRNWLIESKTAPNSNTDIIERLIELVNELSPEFCGEDYVGEVSRVIDDLKIKNSFLEGQLYEKDNHIKSLNDHIYFLEEKVLRYLTKEQQEEIKPQLRLIKKEDLG